LSGFVWENLAIVVAALVGGVLPLVRTWSERALHLFVAAATGVFLGVTFVHLLPEFAELHPPHVAWRFVGASIVVLFVIERVVLYRPSESSDHTVLGYATFIGLMVHSVAAGYALGVSSKLGGSQGLIFVALISHKSVEAFSLTTVLLLAGLARSRVMALLLLLSLMVPVGAFLGQAVSTGVGLPIPTAMATGTFIYVCLCDLLPEVFHHRQDAWLKLALVVVGMIVAVELPSAHG